MSNNLVKRNGSLVPNRDDLFYPFESFFNKTFDEIMSDFGGLKSLSKKTFPHMDVVTSDGKWIVELAVPGMTERDITVEISDEPASGDAETIFFGAYTPPRRVLTISGGMSEEHKYPDNTNYLIKELKRSSWSRSFILPDEIRGEPEATVKNGMLKLAWTLPKEEVKIPEKKLIPVKAAN